MNDERKSFGFMFFFFFSSLHSFIQKAVYFVYGLALVL